LLDHLVEGRLRGKAPVRPDLAAVKKPVGAIIPRRRDGETQRARKKGGTGRMCRLACISANSVWLQNYKEIKREVYRHLGCHPRPACPLLALVDI
jgi:hypothetical protein